MKKAFFASIAVLFIVWFFTLPVLADDKDTLVRFKGGIGVHPVSNVSGTATNPPTNTIFPEVTRNVVRGVNPAGQIWVIEDLDARVKTNGDIKVRGKGLILGGGNNAGRATGQFVFATLICESAGFIERNTNTAGVPLTANGDFEIDDVLTPLPAGGCASPMLLIRNADPTSLAWFAVGILDD